MSNAFPRLLGCCLALAACGPEPPVPRTEFSLTCPGEGDYPHADVVTEAPGDVDSSYAINEPDNAVNGVVASDPQGGGTDVFSRGFETDPPNNYVVVEWSGRRVVDVDGPDFVVFENAFETAGGVFLDPIVVEVSPDGETWTAFPHDYIADDETAPSRDPADWKGFAGVTPTRWDSTTCSDPLDSSAGGDRFDLADLAVEIDGFVYVRLTSAPSLDNPDTGEPYPRDVLSDGFDLDGVYAAETEDR